MKVIYCEFHQSLARNSESRCDWSMARGDDFYGGAPCRMVPRRLIPDNEETVERIKLAVVEIVQLTLEDEDALAVAVLAALDGETP